MLAFSTISHAGTDARRDRPARDTSLAGVADLVLAHGLLKGGLFLVCGIMLLAARARRRAAPARARARALPWAGALWALGTIGLVGSPYVGTFLGHG